MNDDTIFKITCLGCGSTNVELVDDYDFDYDDNLVYVGSYLQCKDCGARE